MPIWISYPFWRWIKYVAPASMLGATWGGLVASGWDASLPALGWSLLNGLVTSTVIVIALEAALWYRTWRAIRRYRRGH